MNWSADDVQTERYSLNHWQANGRDIDGTTSDFFRRLQSEEAAKQARLQALASSIDLPVYEHHVFDAKSVEVIADHCRVIERKPGWGMALKLSDASGLVTYRRLGASSVEVLAAAGRAVPGSTLSLTPYRKPDISGTLWKRGDQLLVELVRGPHFWLSKRAPDGVTVIIASASPVRPFLRLEPTGSAEDETRLRRIVGQAVRYVFGRGMAATLDLDVKAYAEFHWFEVGVMRFIECSFDAVWTS